MLAVQLVQRLTSKHLFRGGRRAVRPRRDGRRGGSGWCRRGHSEGRRRGRGRRWKSRRRLGMTTRHENDGTNQGGQEAEERHVNLSVGKNAGLSRFFDYAALIV